jgi:hypothetical protein
MAKYTTSSQISYVTHTGTAVFIIRGVLIFPDSCWSFLLLAGHESWSDLLFVLPNTTFRSFGLKLEDIFDSSCCDVLYLNNLLSLYRGHQTVLGKEN